MFKHNLNPVTHEKSLLLLRQPGQQVVLATREVALK